MRALTQSRSPGHLLLTTLIFLVITPTALLAQNTKTADSTNVEQLKAKLDSLQQALNDVASKIDGSSFSSSDSVFNIDDLAYEEMTDTTAKLDDRRSRRKRLDALLGQYMQRPGVINFNGDATSILQHRRNERLDFATATGSFDLFVATRLGENTLVFINMEARGGEGPNDHISSTTSLNADAGSLQSTDGLDRLHVLEAWVEFTTLWEMAKFTAGKIDLTNYFDNNAMANDETAQFISGAFVNSSALPIAGNTPGIRMRFEHDLFFLQLAVASLDNAGGQIFHDLFRIASTGFRVNLGDRYISTYRVYAYEQSLETKARGIGCSIDQPIGRGMALWGRYNWNNKDLGLHWGIKSAWSVGGQIEKTIFERSFIIGAAYGVSNLPQIEPKEELFEIYMRHQLNDWTYLSPHVQYLDTNELESNNILIFGLRTQLNF